MKTINATEFKAKCLHFLDVVQATGDELVITKRGKPVARLTRENHGQPWLALRGKGRFHGDASEPVLKEEEVEALKG